MLRLAPWVLIGLLIGPIVAGGAGVVPLAFGHFPLIGEDGWSLAPWRALFDWPGVARGAALSVWVGISSTAISLAVVCVVMATGQALLRRIEPLLSPILAMPHAAVAFGLAFVIAPSGWAARLLSPWATGWDRPPDMLVINDPLGFALIAGLTLKEAPFLLLMALAAQGQVRAAERMTLARSLGYAPVTGWMKTIFPAIYRQIRLPIYVVLAFSMTVVDAALILGPGTPPVLSVQILRWMSDPDLSMRMVAAAGAMLQLGLVLGGLFFWICAERLIARLGRLWISGGARRAGDGVVAATARGAAVVLGGVLASGIAASVFWSFAAGWPFGAPWPTSWTFAHWVRHGPAVLDTLGDTMVVAIVTVGVAIALTLLVLESARRHGASPRLMTLIYVPLLVPQIVFLPGLQVLLLGLGADRGVWPVILAHLVFVLPYVMLTLRDPWAEMDSRFDQMAAALGARPRRVFWSVRLPMLARPILVAMAVGVAVSVAQYLPSLLMGGGRVATVTTEALALASGGDRRAIAVFSLSQAGAALVPFVIAMALPRVIYRNRKGMLHG